MVPKGSEPTYICSWLPLFHLFDPAARLIVKDYYAVGYKAWAHLLIQQAQPDINREFKSCLYLFGIQFAVYQIHVLIYCLFFTAFRFASLKLNLWWRKAASLGQMELEKQRSVFPPPPAMLRWFRTDGFRAHCSLEWTQTQTHMGMGPYLLKIQFLVGWTSIYQLFWCSPGVQGFDTLPHQCSSCLLKGARS